MQQLAQWAPALISLIAAVYVYGRLSERVAEHGEKIKSVLVKQDTHTVELTKLIAWHDGFTAGNHRG